MNSLVDAVKRNDLTFIKEVLNNNNVDTVDEWGDTLLHLAVKSGNSKVVELLLSKKPDLYILNFDNLTSVDVAIELKNKKIISFLLPLYNGVLSNFSLQALNQMIKNIHIDLSSQFLKVNSMEIIKHNYTELLSFEIRELFIF